MSRSDRARRVRLPDVLVELSADWDAMFTRMQTRRARARMKSAFGASPKALGQAAVAAARATIRP